MPTITLTDGSVVDFGEKAKVIKRSYIAEDGTLVVNFAFQNGEVREFRMEPGHPLLARAALHGLDQKFGDANAGLTDVEDCIAAFEDMAERIGRGDWTEKREGSGLAGVSVLAKALVEVTGKSLEEVKEFLKQASAAEKQAMRRIEPIASVVQRIEAERGSRSSKKVDVSGLLAGLGLRT